MSILSVWTHNVLRQSVVIVCFALFALVSQVNRAHALSAGCTQVNAGALTQNVNAGLNAPPFVFNAAFNAGETITWTITGEPDTANITIDLGAALAVTGGSATFTFATSATFRIDQNLQPSLISAASITATCSVSSASSTNDETAVNVLTNAALSTELTQLDDLRREIESTNTAVSDAVERARLQRQIEALERREKIEEAILKADRSWVKKAQAFIAAGKVTMATLRATYRFTPGKNARKKIKARFDQVSRVVVLYQRYVISRLEKIARTQAQITDANARLATLNRELQAVGTGGTAGATPFQPVASQSVAGFQDPATSGTSSINPLKLGLNGDRASFFADLNSLRALADQKSQKQLANLGYQATGNANPSTLSPNQPNVWVRGSVAGFDSDQSGAKRDGHSADIATGAYFHPGDGLVLGGLFRFREAESNSSTLFSKLKTHGYGAGLHTSFVLTPELTASGFAFYELSDNDISTSNGTGSYDAEQVTLTAELQGKYYDGPWSFEPAASITYAHVDRDGYTNSAGTPVSGGTTERGQLSFGPTVRYHSRVYDETIESVSPFVSVSGVWNFIKADDTTLTNGAVIQGDEFLARLNGGVSLGLANDMKVSLNGGYSGFGASNLDIYSLSGQISIPFGGR